MALFGPFEHIIKKAVDSEAAEQQRSGTNLNTVGTASNPSDKVLTLANFVTLIRFLLTIIFLVLFVTKSNRVLALVLYAIAAITDFLDGLIARSTNTVSWVGKVADPIMDRFLLAAGVIGLVAVDELPLWIAVLLLLRDFVLAVGAARLKHYRSRPLDVIYLGKFATAALLVGYILLFISKPDVAGLGLVKVSWLPGLNDRSAGLGIFFVYVGVVASLITAVIYLYRGFRIRNRVLKERAAQAGQIAQVEQAGRQEQVDQQESRS